MKTSLIWILLTVLVIVIMVFFVSYDRPLKPTLNTPDDITQEFTNGFMLLILLVGFFYLSNIIGRIIGKPIAIKEAEKKFRGLAIIDELPENTELVCLIQEREPSGFFLKLRDTKAVSELCYLISEEKVIDVIGNLIEKFPVKFNAQKVDRVDVETKESLDQTAKETQVYVIYEIKN